MSDLINLPNIGRKLSTRLAKVGITSIEEFKQYESEDIFMKLRSKESDLCFNTLCALEGAKKGIRWHGLSEEDKLALREFYDSIK
ncbi:TfoX/Sxy family DNA transformation protein [Halocella sp. SP3-1]|uniref:TfoX/Sxy family DNA transformation protein n=1 Tax=Halocella sp. SP3-1 TaxID=2382161 RepID=UPI000F756247|nr:TfoX/Sxy family DNA transformation protein [Halocella sp. SP3-1]AZO96428.1 competence protein TfoX [Halocella sp. SP3-1]